jgi:hypothetical protein
LCLGEYGDGPGRAIHADALTRYDPLGCARHAYHGGDAVLAGNYRAVRIGSAHLHYQTARGEEQGCPSGIGGGSYQDLAWFQMRSHRVEDDACDPGDAACRCRSTCERGVVGTRIMFRLGLGAVGEQDTSITVLKNNNLM